ncbi:MAG: hypothetical protein LPJ89_01350 [Hymenobacteraceae bacterium]|nr:hypothetical protein [Hymenobacteraceae bacterium]MDX5395691.1 hypothetical protein [Hymenobacteraceae bacterium]MDX5442408.1 hypothetical protein [Hymenobacteraceae bacterium]MDX5511745.1 hypothetical protein [Hymenobacteraceae bacterium]
MELISDGGIFAIIIAIISLLFLGLWIWSIIWAYNDAEARGKPGWAVALLVALFSWPLSLLLWVIFRPDRKQTIT